MHISVRIHEDFSSFAQCRKRAIGKPEVNSFGEVYGHGPTPETHEP